MREAAQRKCHALIRLLGVLFSSTLCVFAVFIFCKNAYYPFVENAVFLGILLILLFAVFVFLSAVGYVKTILRDGGPIPAWLDASRLETFVRQELRRIAEVEERMGAELGGDDHAGSSSTKKSQQSDSVRNESGSVHLNRVHAHAPLAAGGEAGKMVDDDEAEQFVSANAMLSAALDQRRQFQDDVPSPSSAEDEEDEQNSEDDDDQDEHRDKNTSRRNRYSDSNGDHEDTSRGGGGLDNTNDDENSAAAGVSARYNIPEIDSKLAASRQSRAQRRRRKQRKGLEVLTVAQVASGALLALDSDVESREEQMKFLLAGAKLCRYCNIYKLQEAHHCDMCGRCVCEAQFHSIYLGKCIGSGNQKFHLLYVFYLVLAALLSLIVSHVALKRGYAHVLDPKDPNFSFFFCIVATASSTVMLLILLFMFVYYIGRGENVVAQIEREERQNRAQTVVRISHGSLYRPLFEDEEAPVASSGRFVWSNMHRALGLGPIFPGWFLPSDPIREAPGVIEERFWSSTRATIERQLYSVADAAAGDREDEAMNNNINSTAAVAAPRTTTSAYILSSGEASLPAAAADRLSRTMPGAAVAAAATTSVPILNNAETAGTRHYATTQLGKAEDGFDDALDWMNQPASSATATAAAPSPFLFPTPSRAMVGPPSATVAPPSFSPQQQQQQQAGIHPAAPAPAASGRVKPFAQEEVKRFAPRSKRD